MHYGARFYDPYINRFISADSIVPSPGNPQDLNRYSYVRNSPLNFSDPSGHCGGDIRTGESHCSGFNTLTVDSDLSGARVVSWDTPPPQPPPPSYLYATHEPIVDPWGNGILWFLGAISIGGGAVIGASGGQGGGYAGNMPPMQAALGAGPLGDGSDPSYVPLMDGTELPAEFPGYSRRMTGEWMDVNDLEPIHGSEGAGSDGWNVPRLMNEIANKGYDPNNSRFANIYVAV